MKKHLLLSLLFALSMNSFCQQRETAPTLTKQDYLQKSKKQKTTAGYYWPEEQQLVSLG